MGLRQSFVRVVYARHNRSAAIRRGLREALARLEECAGRGLDLGCGTNRLHPRLIRLDRAKEAGPDCRASADRLPFSDDSIEVVVSQEVLEHLPNPYAALAEVRRVLVPGGVFYLQTPFLIGRHGAPRDYWRFTGDGLAVMLRQAGLEPSRIEPAVGAGTGAYRVGVEFFAVLASALWQRLYLPTKAAGALVLWPLRWLDALTLGTPEAWRIPGGFYALARKPV